jgi:Cu2+-exporting ATPase
MKMDHAAMGHTAIEHAAMIPEAQYVAESHGEHAEHARADHTGHEEMFRKRFWVSLLLSIPVLLYSGMTRSC